MRAGIPKVQLSSLTASAEGKTKGDAEEALNNSKNAVDEDK